MSDDPLGFAEGVVDRADPAGASGGGAVREADANTIGPPERVGGRGPRSEGARTGHLPAPIGGVSGESRFRKMLPLRAVMRRLIGRLPADADDQEGPG